MGYRLVITEKPSVAAAIAKVIGATERKDGYFQGEGYLVSWCVGHLVELAMPEAYEEKYRALLQLTGSTFETIAIETKRQADSMLSFGKVRNR